MNQPPRSPSKSIEQWIDWLAQTRQIHPVRPLCELLRCELVGDSADSHLAIDSVLPRQQLLDLACIDLIQQSRQSQSVQVELYLDQFPQLNEPADVLDLVDAELCVRRELNQIQDVPTETKSFVDRFPGLSDEIEELVRLSSEPPMLRSKHESPQRSSLSAGDTCELSPGSDSIPSDELSFDLLPPVASDGALVSMAVSELPVDAPEWFIGDQCMSRGEDRWLLRGRDTNTGETLALQVIKLPVETTTEAVDQLLQACEFASRVQNPCWVAPVVAAVQSGYLAVIRPWCFGDHWQVASHANEIPVRLKRLAQVAYALQSAHRSRAWHGSLHAKNVIVDHQGGVHLVDVVSGSTGLPGWLNRSARASLETTKSVWSIDSQDLIKLVMQDEIDVPGPWSKGLQATCKQMVADHQADCFAEIGDELMCRADHFVADSDDDLAGARSWRQRLAGWIEGR